MIRVNVHEGGDFTTWWENFRNYYFAQGYDMESDEDITKALHEWNCIDEPDTAYFSFKSEHDYTLFMLRWG